MLANLCDTFRDLSRSPNIVPFHMLGIASYCAIVTLSLTRAVFTMLNFKECHDLEMVSKITQRQLILLSTGMYPTSVLPVSISYASFAESGSHSIPGQQQHSSTLSWCRALITATLYLPSHRRPQPTSSNECLTLLPALSRARRNTTTNWHKSCATIFIGSVCRSGSSSAPWCTAVYRTLLPSTSVSTASRSRMLPLAVNYDPPAAIKLSFAATTRARSAIRPSLSLAQHPTVSNSLPDKLRDPSLSINSFCHQLKTFLFAE